MCSAIVLLSFFSSQPLAEMDFLLNKIPDVAIITSGSRVSSLSSWYSQKPLIVTFAYGRCPGVCNPYLSEIREYVLLQGIPEEKFQMLVLSVDPTDNIAQLRKLAGFDADFPPPSNWTFGMLDKEGMTTLLPAIGFRMQEVGEVYDHNTVLVLVGIDGKVHQWIEGVPTIAQWDRLFRELTNKFVPVYPALSDNVWGSCFEYDPSSGTWRMNWGLLMIFAPSVITVCILIFLQGITRYSRAVAARSILFNKKI